MLTDRRSPALSRRRFVASAALAAPLVAVAAPGVLAQSASPATSPAASPASGAVSITSEPWGKVDDLPVERYHLKNAKGMEVAILTYGGIVQSWMAPDRNGKFDNIVLGFAKVDDYVAQSPYFGAIIGRYANRIAKGTFTLDGTTYHLDINNTPNSLHGGYRGFDKYVWDAKPSQSADSASLTLSRTSPDDEEHYPGTLQVTVTYTVKNDDSLTIDYTATTDKDTIINLTNHSYFNLAGEGNGTVYDQVMQLMASHYTPVDATSIPTGQIAPVAGTPFDFTQPHAIGERIRDGAAQQLLYTLGYDHNWVLDRPSPDDKSLIIAAKTVDPASGRVLTTSTTEPGVQLYTGNFLTGSFAGTSDKIYRQGDAFTLETQHYPDSPNEPKFPSTVLKPGEPFKSTTVYAVSTQ